MLKFGSKSDINVSYKCTVRLLEDTEVIQCDFESHEKGKHLLEQVCRQLNLIEKDYFGLRYVDHTRQRHWLDPAKAVLKQVKDMEPILFSFRVKFYPPDPFRLKEEITRYQIYLQLKRDLLHGRLYCTPAEASLLAAYIVQSELGDYDPEEHEGNYVSELNLLLKQTPEIEEKIMEIHQTQLKGQTPAQVENNFLRKACQLDTYGVDPHPVKDHRGNQLYLGINHCGILTFQGSRKTHHFRWVEVQKINYEGKMFIVHVTYNEDPRIKKKRTVGFKCPTGAACRHVWRCAIEQMLFFTLPSSSEAPSVVTGGSFFSWGSKFRYSGRVEREILEDVGPLRREEPAINRSFRTASLRRKASSVPATPSTPIGSELGYGSLPRANHSAPLSDSRLDGGLLVEAPLSSPYCSDNTLPLLETVSEDQEMCSKHRTPVAANQAGEVIEDFLRHERGELDVTTTASEPISQTETVLTHHLVNGGGGKETEGVHSHHTFDDYYFRDSFEQSSSESQLVEASGGFGAKPSSQPLPRPSPSLKPAPLPAPPAPAPVTTATAPRRFNLLQVFVPSFLCVALSLALATMLVLESDCEILGTVRRWPEMVVLRRDYYEPAKEFLRQKLARLLS
ncbi:FERM domain-containing protein 5 isoform X3 [Zootermopsis nevadensis]|uniref:FERM domain-containing protein 5 isoform X3 n=1 Tax=Zootermopsis nevadensis TaxID=136037 RepID=UPI000B8E376C|nr:FERM domain-containing protein 5 isoform X3 [Zootermopsis nevadensis]